MKRLIWYMLFQLELHFYLLYVRYDLFFFILCYSILNKIYSKYGHYCVKNSVFLHITLIFFMPSSILITVLINKPQHRSEHTQNEVWAWF
jgi:hypothetical protein